MARLRAIAARVLAAVLIAGGTFALAGQYREDAQWRYQRASARDRLRAIRRAVDAYERDRGRLPGDDLGAAIAPYMGPPPVNGYTGSSAIVIPPDGVDAVAFAEKRRDAGWVWLPRGGRGAGGPLPPGTVLLCAAPDPALNFHIEDHRRWR